jgi:hypothetical protein
MMNECEAMQQIDNKEENNIMPCTKLIENTMFSYKLRQD